MLLSDVLEVAIGLSFVFLLVSLVISAACEWIETIAKSRGAKLVAGVEELFGRSWDLAAAETRLSARLKRAIGAEPPASPIAAGADPRSTAQAMAADAVRSLYEHPLLGGLYRGTYPEARAARTLPSYVPTRDFAAALVDLVCDGRINAAPTSPGSSVPAALPRVEQLRLAAERIANGQLRGVLLNAVARADGDLDGARSALESWYNSTMDRVSGWYKRRTQIIQFWLGLAAALLLNINALTLAEGLSKDGTLRRALASEAAASATATASPCPGVGSSARADAGGAVACLDGTGLPVGWTGHATHELLQPLTPWGVAPTGAAWLDPGYLFGAAEIALGYLMVALAATLGAPFWFDLLNRLMVIRSTVKPHEKSREEASQDPQDRPAPTPPATVVVHAGGSPPPPPSPPGAIDPDIYADVAGYAQRPMED